MLSRDDGLWLISGTMPVDEMADQIGNDTHSGRFNLKFGNVMWPEGVEVKPGETTTLQPGTIRVDSSVGILYFAVKDTEGQEVGTGASPGHALTLPPGKYVLNIDSEKQIKTLTDDQRNMNVDLSPGEELEIEIK